MDFKQIIDQFIVAGDYSAIMTKALQQVAVEDFDPLKLQAIFNEYEVSYSYIQKEAIHFVLDYIEKCLEDNELQEDEIQHIDYLKRYFHLMDIDFVQNEEKDWAVYLLRKQLWRMYKDHTVDTKEALQKVELQTAFNMNYDEFAAVMKEFAIWANEHGGDVKNLDTFM